MRLSTQALKASLVAVVAVSQVYAQTLPPLQSGAPTPVEDGGIHISGIIADPPIAISPVGVQLPQAPKAPSMRAVHPEVELLRPIGNGAISSFEIPTKYGNVACDVEHYYHTYSGGVAFWGSVSSPERGHFTACLFGEYLTMRITIPRIGTFLLYPVRDNVHAFRHDPPSDTPFTCGAKQPTKLPSDHRDAEDDTGGEEMVIGGAVVVDQLMLYTPRYASWLEDEFGLDESTGSPDAASSGHGSNGLMMAANFVNLHEAAINQALTNSGDANAQINIIGHGLVDLDDGQHWDGAQGGSGLEGFLDAVYWNHSGFEIIHECRDAIGADLVGIMTGIDDGGTGGTAPVISHPAAPGAAGFGFQIYSAHWGVIGEPAVEHEIGHNLGCAHDRHTTGNSPNGLHNYSNGHYWLIGTNHDDVDFRGTIMSYVLSLPNANTSEHDDHGNASPGSDFDAPHGHGFDVGEHIHKAEYVPHYSNPSVLIDGNPTGVPEGDPDSADCARTIDETSNHISAFRTRVPLEDEVWVDLSYEAPDGTTETGEEDWPFDTVLEGILLVHPEGTLVFKPGVETGQFGFSKRIKKIRVNGETGTNPDNENDNTGNLGG